MIALMLSRALCDALTKSVDATSARSRAPAASAREMSCPGMKRPLTAREVNETRRIEEGFILTRWVTVED